MKQHHHHFRAFGWHLYLSKAKLHLVPLCNNRGNGLGRQLGQLRNRRWNHRHGRCEMCGQVFDKAAMSLHHILPYSEFPELARKAWNLLMLCPRCHYHIHKNPVLAMEHMQRIGREHGINLSQAFTAAATRGWQQKQQPTCTSVRP